MTAAWLTELMRRPEEAPVPQSPGQPALAVQGKLGCLVMAATRLPAMPVQHPRH